MRRHVQRLSLCVVSVYYDGSVGRGYRLLNLEFVTELESKILSQEFVSPKPSE
jgi:hypothetical protein